VDLWTERLHLREFELDDWEATLAYQLDPRYLRFYPWTHRTEPEVRAFVRRFVDAQSERPRRIFQLAICFRETGALIGNCGLRRKPDNEWEGDVGFELAPLHWGDGLATEAARAMVGFGFGELGLHRISATCLADNLGSRRVLEKVGLQLEGRLREHEHFKDRWWDTLLYGLLVHEWVAG
jgi:ribosomal-protein-alanine N-acetyltransferase